MRFSADQRRDENSDPRGWPNDAEGPAPPGSVRVEEDVMGFFPDGGRYFVQMLPDQNDSRYFNFRILVLDNQNRRLRLCGRGCRETNPQE